MRQGDPLLPLLFCLIEEFLSRSLSLNVLEVSLLSMLDIREVMTPTHILYAGDILIFCRGVLRKTSIAFWLFFISMVYFRDKW